MDLPEVLRARTTGYAFRRDDLETLVIRGADRESWLNGLVTCDVANLSLGAVAYGLAVTIKGRVLADLIIFKGPDALTVFVPGTVVGDLLAAFHRYLIMEDVEIDHVEPKVTVFEVDGPVTVPPHDGCETARFDALGFGGALVWSASEAKATAAIERSLEKDAIAGAETRERLRLAKGVPRFGVDFGLDTYPQEADLAERALSFSKGCYLGQEVVCMLEMRGHVKRRLVHLALEGDDPVSPGAPVTGPLGDLGSITSAAAGGDGATYALAMLKIRGLAEPLRVGERSAKLVTPLARS